jgi:hypothetical protein
VCWLLSTVLVVEAFTAWAWWASALNIGYKIHAREHFCVNVVSPRNCASSLLLSSPLFYTRTHTHTHTHTQSVAGGLLLLSFVGAGKYTVDELMKKKE